jgi:cereblon
MIDVLDKERQGLDPKLKEIVDRESTEHRDLLLCANCNHGIARQSDRIEVNGAFSHYFTNPYGIEYHVGCFSTALGCAISGSRMAADTWFAGFVWQLASCEACSHHLGWYFTGADAEFYGLVLDYVREAE